MDPELASFLTERFDEINRRFDDVYGRFDVIDQRFDAVDRRFEAVDRRFDAVDRRFDTMDRRFDATDRKIDEKFEEAKRESGVVAEGLREEIRAVADGHLVLDRRLQEHCKQSDAAHGEIISLVKLSYRDLDRRVKRLERRRRRGAGR